MPRFSRDERTYLITIAEAFADSTADKKVRSCLKSAIRKLQQSERHHARIAEQRGTRNAPE